MASILALVVFLVAVVHELSSALRINQATHTAEKAFPMIFLRSRAEIFSTRVEFCGSPCTASNSWKDIARLDPSGRVTIDRPALSECEFALAITAGAHLRGWPRWSLGGSALCRMSAH